MLTNFQRTYIQQLAQRPDVKHLCWDYLNDTHEDERIIPVLFITTDEKLNAVRLGKKRVLGVIPAK